MRKGVLFAGGVVVAAAAGFAAYLSQTRDATVTSASVDLGATLPPSAPAARAPSAAPVETVESAKPNDPSQEVAAETIDDGDQHETAQLAVKPLETPPPPREAFGADPGSETAALGEARAILETLQQDSDPEVKAQVAKLLQSIDAAR